MGACQSTEAADSKQNPAADVGKVGDKSLSSTERKVDGGKGEQRNKTDARDGGDPKTENNSIHSSNSGIKTPTTASAPAAAQNSTSASAALNLTSDTNTSGSSSDDNHSTAGASNGGDGNNNSGAANSDSPATVAVDTALLREQMPPLPSPPDGCAVPNRGRFASYASGASTPTDDRSMHSEGSACSLSSTGGRAKLGRNGSGTLASHHKRSKSGSMIHSASAIGLDQMIEDRREDGNMHQNIVHIEVPFGKPIEEVYDGVHNGPVLGSGISGLVRLVTHKATGLKYAVKVLDLGLVETSEGLAALREEVFIMCQLDHPNIVRLEEVYESHSEIYLVQELCLGGELFDRLDEQPDYHYTEGECARLVKQMLCAVRYLHSKGIIHRDLKLENFLFSSTAKDSELKMIDFGLSKHFRFGDVQHEAVGTPYTVAPEVIRGTYDERCDIWSIGVITFLLLSGDPPFGGCGGPEPLMTVRANILAGAFAFEPEDIWQNVSSAARQFIKKLLVTDPKSRPTAREAQMHTWLKEWASRTRKENDNVLNPNVVKALVNFKEFSDMRKLLCEVLSFTLLPDQIKDLRREFEKMDTDGSGEISLAALKDVLMTNAGAGSLGALTEEEVEDIFNAMRVRKTETRIHWHEFIAAGLSQCQVDDRNLRLAFDRLDSDHKGYITLDDIMDLMGSDALQSEDAMRRMWGDSIKAVNKGTNSLINYDDFLLLMKGQSKEPPPPPQPDFERGVSHTNSFMSTSSRLHVVPETEESIDSSTSSPVKAVMERKAGVITLPSGDVVTLDGSIFDRSNVAVNNLAKGSNNPEAGASGALSSAIPAMPAFPSVATPSDVASSPGRPSSPMASHCHSAPSTPADHKLLVDWPSSSGTSTDESPCAWNQYGGATAAASAPHMPMSPGYSGSGPGVPGSAASLTPPHSPVRGAQDYITPSMGGRRISDMPGSGGPAAPPPGFHLLLPGLPNTAIGAQQQQLKDAYKRRRSRSVDDKDEDMPGSPAAAAAAIATGGKFVENEPKDLHLMADAVRDLLLPETDHANNPSAFNEDKDRAETALQVNRKLYRAHRQMRLAVLEASKRFEEQQVRHAHQVILAQQNKQSEKDQDPSSAVGMIQAGLVMRHGHTQQVSSEAIRRLLEDNQRKQLALVEKANRRGGRGRRSRKKTTSDMSGMLRDLNQASSEEVPEPTMQRHATMCSATSPSSASVSQLHSVADGGAGAPGLSGSATFKVMSTTDLNVNSTHSAEPVLASSTESDAHVNNNVNANSTTTTTTTTTEGQLRSATVPGEFRKTQDPFGMQGRYGGSRATTSVK